MLSRLWGWVAAAFGILVAALLLVMGQRDKAKNKTAEVRRKLATETILRGSEQDIAAAVHKARQGSQKTRKEHEERPSSTRPSGSLRRE